jgi:serine/threonine protein kinase
VDADRRRQIDRIFRDVLEREPHERALFLERACADDPSLRIEVEALIRSDERASDSLQSAAVPSGSLKGKTFGPYEVKTLLGAGGMGEVYRARDTKLKRDVAMKVLPYAFSRDVERLARFQREAEVQASLSHPHIAAVYELATFGDMRFLILELVEGETLADRI